MLAIRTFRSADLDALYAISLATGQERLEAEWWPKLRRQYADPATRLATEWSADQRRAYAIHHPQPTPQRVVELYPAHLHLNLLERTQGRGAGTMPFSEWMARASREGVGATHVGVNNANTRAVQFWSRRGFDRLKLEDGSSDRTIWMGRS